MQEAEISQWEVPDFFLKLTFLTNKTFKTWGKSLQLLYAKYYEEKCLAQYGLSSLKRPPRLDILGGRLREVQLYSFGCYSHRYK